MKKILYGLSMFFLKLFSYMPFWLLFGISGIISFLLNYILSYRKKVVTENLLASFPEKSEKEICSIRRDFYRYFSRMLLESIKLLSIHPSELEKRISFENPEYLSELFQQNKSVIALAAHYGNWEWLLGLRNSIPHHSMAIYKPLNNRYFDQGLIKVRERFGGQMVSMREIPKVLSKFQKEGKLSLSVYICDQSPVWEEVQYWTKFLNQQTPVYLGPEKLAKKYNAVVIYFRMKILKRGKYQVEIVPVTENPGAMMDYQITELQIGLLEEDIIRRPEYWLWSHRRWKLTKKRMLEESKGIYRFEGNIKKKNSK